MLLEAYNYAERTYCTQVVCGKKQKNTLEKISRFFSEVFFFRPLFGPNIILSKVDIQPVKKLPIRVLAEI